MDIGTVKRALETAISENVLDTQLFADFDSLVGVDSKLAAQAQDLLPLFTKLATHTALIDELPQSLIPKILQEASLKHIFELIPPKLFEAGLDEPSTAPMLIQMLLKTTPENTVALELCSKAIDQLLDPYCTYAGLIEQLVGVLAAQNCLPPLPDQKLYESIDPQVQARLMALNLVLLGLGKTPRFLFWDLTAPDIKADPLLLGVHIVYIGNLCALGVDVLSQMPVLCPLYIADEPFICHDLERVFLELLEAQPIKFRELDAQYGLTKKQSVSFWARLPPSYLVNFPSLIEELSLNSRTLPVFCNLVTSVDTFKLLNLTPRSINGLSFDLRAELVAAATLNSETANQFVGRFPSIMDAIVIPAAHPDSAQWQRIINANLKAHGIRINPAPEITAAAAQ